MLLISLLTFLLSVGHLHASKANPDKYFMDKLCGSNPMVLDGDDKPGTWFQLTSASKYLPNMNCTLKFRAALPGQRLVISVEKLNIVDCPADTLRIYDGTNLLNKDIKQQCGSTGGFFFTTTTNQVSFTFTSNAAVESAGFQIAIALHFPAVATCPQSLGLFLCANKNCISKKMQCDAHNHCGDSTDEMSCSLIGKRSAQNFERS